MRKNGTPTSIRVSPKGSLIDVKQTLLVFLNNVLQEPGIAYQFDGGSNITFTEAPKVGDTCAILFYRGTGGVDVISRDIIETIKTGDTVKINAGDSQNSLNSIKIEDLFLELQLLILSIPLLIMDLV